MGDPNEGEDGLVVVYDHGDVVRQAQTWDQRPEPDTTAGCRSAIPERKSRGVGREPRPAARCSIVVPGYRASQPLLSDATSDCVCARQYYAAPYKCPTTSKSKLTAASQQKALLEVYKQVAGSKGKVYVQCGGPAALMTG